MAHYKIIFVLGIAVIISFMGSTYIHGVTIASSLEKKKSQIKKAVVKNNWSELKKLILAEPEINLDIPIKEHATYPFGFSPLSIAARLGELEMVQFLIEHGAMVDMVGPYGVTALVGAVEKPGNSAVVKFLVEKGANINVGDRMSESTALDRAADDEIKTYLEVKGARHGPWYIPIGKEHAER